MNLRPISRLMAFSCLLAFSLLSYSSAMAQESLTINSTGNPNEKAALVGSAYNTVKEGFVGGQCIDGQTKPTGSSQSSFQLDDTISESRLSNELGVSVGAHARFGVIQANMSADFLSRSISNSFSVSAIYSAYYFLQPDKLMTNTVDYTKAGLRVKGDRVLWTQTCGNLFVDEIRRGAKLFISVRIDFKSSEEKQKFSGEFSIEGPLAGVKTTLGKATESFGKDIKVTISATQIGGDVTQLSGIFGGKDDLHYFTDCTLGAFEACAKTIENALKYASDLEHGFPSQIKDQEDGDTPSKRRGGAAILSYGLSTYESYGLYNGAPPHMEPRVELARDELSQKFETAYRQTITGERLLLFPLTPGRRAQIETVVKALKANMDLMIGASVVCYSTPEQCPAQVDALSLKKIDAEILMPDSFATLCVESLELSPLVPLRVTVDTLIGFVDPGGVPHDAIDCKIYQRLLGRLKRVELQNKGLSDLTPLVSLGNVEVLKLDNNQITDIAPIGELNNLDYLSLSGNKIANIDSLSRLVLLRFLSLDDNHIVSAVPVSQFTLLRDASFANDGIANITPFSDLPRLEYLDLHGTNIKDLSPMKSPMRLRCINLKDTLLTETQISAFMKVYEFTITAYRAQDSSEAFGNVGENCSGLVTKKRPEETEIASPEEEK